jgi:hypothetical protein
MAVGVGGAAAFLAVAMAATLTGGGSGPDHPHTSKQADSVGTPGALLPPLSTTDLGATDLGATGLGTFDATPSAAGDPTVVDAAQTGAPTASSSSLAKVVTTTATDAAPQPGIAATTASQPVQQSRTNPAATTTAPQPAAATTTTTAAAAAPPPVTYSGITGWACKNNGSATFRPVGESDGSTDGWKILTGNDGTGSGCSNGFLAMPMSGDAGTDAANHSDWTFTISPVTTGTCRIQVYIPKPSSSAAYEVGGTSALYGVYNGPTVAGLGLIGTFSVDQAADRGGSVALTVPVTQSLLRIRLHDQGVDYTSSPKLMYGVAAVRVTCTGKG